ncbi:MAG: UDP-N-acetylglucosamine 2-epimerase [Bryobacterales bacterium]
MSGLLFIFGTRPEAIKLAPLILRAQRELEVRVCSTGQHRELLDDALGVFGIAPDFDLGVMRPWAEPDGGCGADALGARRGDWSDETRRDRGARRHHVDLLRRAGGLLRGVPVAHVEAGLRTGDLGRPFPEEAHRVMAGRIARWHFAATRAAAANLWQERRGARARVRHGKHRRRRTARGAQAPVCAGPAAKRRKAASRGDGAPARERGRGAQGHRCGSPTAGCQRRRPSRLCSASQPRSRGGDAP